MVDIPCYPLSVFSGFSCQQQDTVTDACVLSDFTGLFILILLSTSLGKLLDNSGFAEVIGTYRLGIPEHYLLPLALSVSLAELFFAIRLYMEKQQLLNAWALVLIHAGYLSLARSLTQQTLVEDSVLTALALLFVWVVKRLDK